MKNRQMEKPCKESNKSCVWIEDSYCNEEGDLQWGDVYCAICFRSRNYALEEFDDSFFVNAKEIEEVINK